MPTRRVSQRRAQYHPAVSESVAGVLLLISQRCAARARQRSVPSRSKITSSLSRPAAPGGGWDQTARVLQQVIERRGLARIVEVENVPGAAGTIGLAQFVNAGRGNTRSLLVNGLVMLGAMLWNDSPVSIAQVTPIARLTGEYEVVAVPAASPSATCVQLVDALRRRPAAFAWGGGSAGGTDHILAGLIVEAAGVDPRRVNYIAFSGGGEAVAALLGGHVTAGISGYSEFAAAHRVRTPARDCDLVAVADAGNRRADDSRRRPRRRDGELARRSRRRRARRLPIARGSPRW